MEKSKKYNEDVELSFIYTKAFMKAWKKSGLTNQDLARFEQEVKEFEETNEDPSQQLGETQSGTGGGIKYRFSSSDDPSGKSGGSRIIYTRFGRRVYAMIYVYSKSSKESLSGAEKTMIKQVIQVIKKKHK